MVAPTASCHRADGGTHDLPGLDVLTCSSCHKAHHRGDLKLSGTAKDLRVDRPAANPVGLEPVGLGPIASAAAHVGQHANDARLALVTLGFAARVADEAVASAVRTAP